MVPKMRPYIVQLAAVRLTPRSRGRPSCGCPRRASRRSAAAGSTCHISVLKFSMEKRGKFYAVSIKVHRKCNKNDRLAAVVRQHPSGGGQFARRVVGLFSKICRVFEQKRGANCKLQTFAALSIENAAIFAELPRGCPLRWSRHCPARQPQSAENEAKTNERKVGGKGG